MGEVIAENDLGRSIHYRQRITHAGWSSEHERWRLAVLDLDSGITRSISCNFLWMCQGYYRHDQGYTPTWPGLELYRGRLVHPQTWPDDLDYTGKRVLVIGSDATAATLIPAMVEPCSHITMLQRSPTFFRIGRNANDLADQLRALEVDETWIHEITRRKILAEQGEFARKARSHPKAVKKFLLDPVRDLLGDEQQVAEHFTPRYRPWQQRVAFVPDGA